MKLLPKLLFEVFLRDFWETYFWGDSWLNLPLVEIFLLFVESWLKFNNSLFWLNTVSILLCLFIFSSLKVFFSFWKSCNFVSNSFMHILLLDKYFFCFSLDGICASCCRKSYISFIRNDFKAIIFTLILSISFLLDDLMWNYLTMFCWRFVEK